ncbi:right-handed parallel beta-helix repeat-containing protein [Halobacteria archaeon HArc-gm2]|nr:right-handed parallel beta-helix repeat-containing protein [Halobacteria archaeon HArc-gm2]
MTDDNRTRRRYLKTLGGVAGLAALAGCSWLDPGPGPSETETPTPDGGTETPGPDGTETSSEPPSGENVIDLVEAGASPDGDEPTVPVLEDAVGDGKTLYFPPGEYLLTQEWRVRDLTDLSVVGRDATLRVEEGFDDSLFVLGNADSATGLTIEGLAFDFSAPNTGGRPIHGIVTDGLSVTDVSVTGTVDVDMDVMRFDVTDPQGNGVVKRMNLPDGASAEYPITGCYVGEKHTGTLRFVDCHIAGFPDNGLYASSATGKVVVEGGLYENNNVSSVRVSGPAEVRGVTVRCDRAPKGFGNMRGIRLREGSNVLVENCEVEMKKVTGSDGAITMSSWLDRATIRDTNVTVDANDVAAILAKSPNDRPDGPDGDGDDFRIRVENVTISGSAENTAAVRLLEREGCLVDNACIVQTGSARDGIQCTRVSDSTLSNSSISVTGRPVVLNDATVTREALRTSRLGANAAASSGNCRRE